MKKQLLPTAMLLAIPLALARSAFGQVPPPAPPPPVPNPPPADLMQSTGGSLFQASLQARTPPPPAVPTFDRPGATPGANPATPPPAAPRVSFFAVPPPEPRLIRKHDLVTIVVREESAFSSEGKSKFDKTAEFKAVIDEFVRLRLGVNDFGVVPSVGAIKPRLGLSAERKSTGDANVERADSFTARIQAEVLDVKPNGTLVLIARKRIETDDEKQLMVLSGTCRAADLTADNTVLSTQLADLDLTKTHKGAVRSATKRGAIPKLLDAIDPF